MGVAGGVFSDFFEGGAILASELAKQRAPVGGSTSADNNQRGYRGRSDAAESRRRQRAASGGAKASQAPSSAQTASTNAEPQIGKKTLLGA